MGKANVHFNNVPLQFVYGTDQSADKFMEVGLFICSVITRCCSDKFSVDTAENIIPRISSLPYD